MTPATPKKIKDTFGKCGGDRSIPWEYSINCCFARAHEMAKYARGENVDAKKFCIKPKPPDKLLRPKDDSGNDIKGPDGKPIEWTYHVAIVVTQQNADGTTTDMVIDPALFPEPVPVDTWIKRVSGGKDSKADEYPLDTYYPHPAYSTVAGFDADKDSGESLRNHWAKLRALRPLIGPPAPRPLGHGYIRFVARLDWEHRRRSVKVTAFPGNLFHLHLDDPMALQNLAVISEMGMIRPGPVAIWQGDNRKFLFATPPIKVPIVSLSEGINGVELITASPQPLIIPANHPMFDTLLERAMMAAEHDKMVYISAFPGEREVDDLLTVEWWHSEYGG